ncbi:hypothetical protein LZ30DRAFT_118554 [Colletotrichum cereale]|nr:hypothetical protein LZ30DRAFT_118554 [Colletotrichum cereale]
MIGMLCLLISGCVAQLCTCLFLAGPCLSSPLTATVPANKYFGSLLVSTLLASLSTNQRQDDYWIQDTLDTLPLFITTRQQQRRRRLALRRNFSDD